MGVLCLAPVTLTDGVGLPIAIEIAGANRHDMKSTKATLLAIVVPRPYRQAMNRRANVLIKALTTMKFATQY